MRRIGEPIMPKFRPGKPIPRWFKWREETYELCRLIETWTKESAWAAYRPEAAGLRSRRGAWSASDRRVEPIYVHDRLSNLRGIRDMADGYCR